MQGGSGTRGYKNAVRMHKEGWKGEKESFKKISGEQKFHICTVQILSRISTHVLKFPKVHILYSN